MKARFIASTLTFCLILLSFSLPSAADTLDRPKIGLVLAGGGARGAAHSLGSFFLRTFLV